MSFAGGLRSVMFNARDLEASVDVKERLRKEIERGELAKAALRRIEALDQLQAQPKGTSADSGKGVRRNRRVEYQPA